MKKIIQLGILAAAITASCGAFAAGTEGVAVEFGGTLTTSSCNVSVNGGQSIDMGSVDTSGLKIGETTTAVPFTVDIKDCPSSIQTAALDFEGNAFSGDNTAFALTSSVGNAAEQVALMIENTASGTYFSPNVSGSTESLDSGAVSIPLAALLKMKSSSVDEGQFAVSTSLHVIYN
ncbi:fimbrial protein [Enterobacter chuandaensis]|uniref:fimbrial protein n=1 Tax=Enterobacter TaxID=547 RepID=UPI00292FD008|nr:fimbrial protein [Enterobacter sp. 296B2]